MVLSVFNSEMFVDSNAMPLLGNSLGGDLIQLTLAGADGMIDPVTGFGTPGGDDSLLGVTHIGAGGAAPGFTDHFAFTYDDSLVGQKVYARFWDEAVPIGEVRYGETELFTLMGGDAFGFEDLDIAPDATLLEFRQTQFVANILIPEPDGVLFGLFVLFTIVKWRKWMKQRCIWGWILGMVTGGLAIVPQQTQAQLALPFDVTASAAITDELGELLHGTNPEGGAPDGCLVQILSAGTNGLPDFPGADGSPGGDDALLFETAIGAGMPPGQTTGRFAAALTPPASGTVLYARVFNASTVAAASHWGQTPTIVFSDTRVMDVSALGLTRTSLPIGILRDEDEDEDGHTNYEEWVASTDAFDETDFLKAVLDVSTVTDLTGDTDVAPLLQSPATFNAFSVRFDGKQGRKYELLRCTDLETNVWDSRAFTDVLSSDAETVLTDPGPPPTPPVYYRLRLHLP